MTDSRLFTTEVINLQEIYEKQFQIPTYQRPYVWGQEEISKLLTDFYKIFGQNPHQSYFIGTILTKEDEGNAELIDGQQRFTTLWLIAFVMKQLNIETELLNFLEDKNKRLRLGFEIRKEVELYLNQLIGHSKESLEISSFEINNLPYLKSVAEGLTTIQNIIQNQFERSVLPAFGDFIYKMVFMVKNRTPINIDMNNLFATINSAGIQLEQSDIVKSNLLKIIGNDKVEYSKIWEACQNMYNFFERNARTVFPESNWNVIDMSNYTPYDPDIFKFKPHQGLDYHHLEFTLDSILNNNSGVYRSPKDKREAKAESKEVYCRSIITFSQLLLHTYRLHLKKENLPDFKGTFHVNRLIEIFSELEARKNSDEIKRFFLLLWNVRFVFDKYVIKWISDVDDKADHLELTNISKNSQGYYSRTNYEKSGSLMLQSVLYFTGDYLRQFWLTPFLSFVIDHNNIAPARNQVLKVIEKIDNQLSLTNLTEKEASFKMLDEDLVSSFNIFDYLRSNRGTSFQHYWFYKLEYILWKEWIDKSDKKFSAYRITSRNSIEHIYPQNPKISAPISKEALHSFGNLVLLSVTQNSEYSNKEVNIKRIEFENKKNAYDTLKSTCIFSQLDWNEENIIQHRDEMISRIVKYYNIA